MDRARLDEILASHARWLANPSTGERAYLRRADLRWADLAGANLAGANLAGADLAGANLSWAYLREAYLDPIRDDVRSILDAAPAEVPGLLEALRGGRVDGSAYLGDCACLVGTIANLRGCEYDAIPGIKPDSYRPAEKWFLAINEGDTPETNPFAAIAAQWIEEWIAERGTP